MPTRPRGPVAIARPRRGATRADVRDSVPRPCHVILRPDRPARVGCRRVLRRRGRTVRNGSICRVHVSSDAGRRRADWVRTLYQWHWISSAVCLLGMLLFAVTGITLNHAAQIGAEPRVIARQAVLPEELAASLAELATPEQDSALPAAVARWLVETLAVRVGTRPAEWSDEEIYLSLPRPGGDAWLRIDRLENLVEYESTDRGWIAYLNDLHKGRHTGKAWSWFIDVFAVACVVFSITGLLILKTHATNRPATWPLVGFGVVLPLLIAILFVH